MLKFLYVNVVETFFNIKRSNIRTLALKRKVGFTLDMTKRREINYSSYINKILQIKI